MNENIEAQWGPTILARLDAVRMSDADRQTAIDAMRSARLLVDACRWVVQTVRQASGLFLKPGAQA